MQILLCRLAFRPGRMYVCVLLTGRGAPLRPGMCPRLRTPCGLARTARHRWRLGNLAPPQILSGRERLNANLTRLVKREWLTRGQH